jgi:WD40 repeat protein/tetratricopeptide (TPR) repeat protein
MNNNHAKHPNPFPGLRPFRSDEHHLFFGREEQTAALLQLLRTNRFLAVVGTSGSGKSSLVRAGMIAELHGGTMTQAGSTWEVMILRPGGSPIENLARAFVDADLYDPEDPSTLHRLLATLKRSRFGLVEAMKQSERFKPGTNLLVVADQFEELFRFRQQGVDSEETAAAFVNLLLTASVQTESPIYVTITMRSDYLGDCSEIPGLAEAVNQGEYLIPRLLRDQKRDAIEKPIGVGGAKISPLLVQRLLNEVGDDSDQLPVLQHALMRMWDAWSTSSDDHRAIDFGELEAAGGLGAALSHHADEIYDALPDDRHRSACEKIFKTLTVKGNDNRGIRRPTRLTQLQAIAASDKGTVTMVLDAFRSSGVTFLMPGLEVELGDRTVLDLSHESLMRGWQRLRGWVEDEAQSARVFRRLLDTARLWGDGKAGLFREPDLQIALSWREQEAPNAEWAEQYGGHFETAIRFLDTSNAEAQAEQQAQEAARQRELAQAQELAESRKQRLIQQHRAARRLRKLLAGLAVVAVIAGVAFVAALVARNEANRLALVASAEKDRAQHSAAEADRERDTARRAQRAEERIAARANAERERAQRENYRSTIMLAESMLQGDAPSKYRVADLLWGAQPELRGWEWGYLMARCPLEQWSLLTQQGGLDTLATSSDGRLLATAGVDGTVALWDGWTRKELWRQKTGRVQALEIDSQRRYVGIGSAEKTQPYFRILALSNGRVLHQAAARGQASVAFSPSGRDFYVSSSKGLERFRSTGLAPLTPVASLPLPRWDAVSWPKVFVDGAGAYVGLHVRFDPPWSHQTALFDAQTLHPVAELDSILPTQELMNLQSVSSPALHSGLGSIVYSEGPYVLVDRFDWHSRKSTGASPLFQLPVVVNYLAFDPRSETALAAGNDGTVMYLRKGGKTQTLWHGGAISGLALLADGRFITAGADGLVKCWRLSAVTDLAANRAAAPDSASANVLAFAGKSLFYQNWVRTKHFLFGINPPRVRVFNRPVAGNYGQHFPIIRPKANEMVVDSPSGLSFYSLRPAGLMSVARKGIHIAGPQSAAFDASGRLMVVSTNAGEVAVFDLNSDQRLPVPEARGQGIVAINAAGKRAALLTKTGLQVWDVATGRLRGRVNYQNGAGPLMDNKNNLAVAPVFHPDGALIAFIESSPASRSLVLWDTTRRRRRASIQSEPGIEFPTIVECQVSCVFSADGNHIFMPCSDAKVRIWDWRLGKELLALSDAKQTVQVAAAPDGVTLAYAGWAPSLRIAKALPWKKGTQRNVDFFRAVDDFRIYTARLPGFGNSEPDEAMEMLGDIHLRRGETTLAKEHYDKAIASWEQTVLEDPKDVKLQSRLAQLYEKRFAAADAASVEGGRDALQRAIKFWQQLKTGSSREQYLLRAQFRLVDRRLSQDEKAGIELLQTLIESYAAQVDKETENRFAKSGLRELLGRLVSVSRKRGDERALHSLIARHTSLAATIGDLEFGDKEWQRAIAAYDHGITAKTTNAELLGKRARAEEALKNWNGAAADWLRAATGNPEGASLLVEFARRLTAHSQVPLADATRAKARALFGEKKVKQAENAPLATELGNRLDKLAAALREQKPWSEIEPLTRACRALHEKLGSDHPQTLESLNRVGYAYWRMKQFDQAIALYEQSVKIEEARYGRKDPRTLATVANLGVNYKDAGRAQKAIPLLEEADRAAKEHPSLAWVRTPLLDAYAIAGANVKVANLLREQLPKARKTLPKDSPQLAGMLAQISLGLSDQKKWAEAEPLLRECLAIREKTQPNVWSTFNTKSTLGGALLGQKKYQGAEPLLLKGYQGMKEREKTIPPVGRIRLAEAVDRLIELYIATNKPDEVKKWRAERAKYPEAKKAAAPGKR